MPMDFCIVHSEFPCHDRTSGGLRLHSLIGLLREAGHRCDYLLTTPQAERKRLGDEDYARYADDLSRMGVRLVDARGGAHRRYHWDVVIFEWYMAAAALLAEFRAWHPDAILITDSVDLTFKRWEAKATLSGLAADAVYAGKVRREELAVYAKSDLVLTLTPDESAEVERLLPGQPTFEVPNIHPMPAATRQESAVPELLFIGSFSHQPNVDAVRWFQREIWPAVKGAIPGCQWTIVGAEAPPDIASFDDPAITVTGRVPDTTPFLARCWISIAPLRFGAGMKGKVGEALAASAPLVTTSFGAQGYALVNGEHAFIADDTPGFTEAVIRVLGSRELRDALGAAGRRVVAERFGRDVMARKIPQLAGMLAQLPRKSAGLPAWVARLLLRGREQWQTRLGWRFRRSPSR